jgi:hypothetical protein
VPDAGAGRHATTEAALSRPRQLVEEGGVPAEAAGPLRERGVIDDAVLWHVQRDLDLRALLLGYAAFNPEESPFGARGPGARGSRCW